MIFSKWFIFCKAVQGPASPHCHTHTFTTERFLVSLAQLSLQPMERNPTRTGNLILKIQAVLVSPLNHGMISIVIQQKRLNNWAFLTETDEYELHHPNSETRIGGFRQSTMNDPLGMWTSSLTTITLVKVTPSLQLRLRQEDLMPKSN